MSLLRTERTPMHEFWRFLGTDQAKTIVSVAAAVTALLTLWKGVVELSKQNALKSFETFTTISNRFRANPNFLTLAEMCERDDPGLRTLTGFDKIEYANFFEEVGILVNSDLLPIDLVKLTWGPYIGLLARSRNFWCNRYFDQTDYYWSAFVALANKVNANTPDLRKVRFGSRLPFSS